MMVYVTTESLELQTEKYVAISLESNLNFHFLVVKWLQQKNPYLNQST